MQIKQLRAALLPLLTIAFLAVLALLPTGCGGGGGGGGGGGNIVTGIVRNSLDGDKEMQNVTVTIGGKSIKTRTVDNANSDNPVGSYSLQNVPNGTQTATVTLTDGSTQSFAFAPPVSSGTNSGVDFYVNIGQISGRIVRPNGEPAANAFVTIAATAETFQTNGDGTFLATLVPQGNTEIFAVEGTASVRKTVAVNFGNTAIGDVKLADDPNPNPPSTPYTLLGKVTVTGVGTPAGTTVLLFRNNIQIESTLTDSAGNYYFYVPIGTYIVRAVRNGFQDAASGNIGLTNVNQPKQTNLTMNSL